MALSKKVKEYRRSLDRKYLPDIKRMKYERFRPVRPTRVYAIRSATTGLWLTTTQNWGKRPRFFSQLADVEKSIRNMYLPRWEVEIWQFQLRPPVLIDPDSLDVNWKYHEELRNPRSKYFGYGSGTRSYYSGLRQYTEEQSKK